MKLIKAINNQTKKIKKDMTKFMQKNPLGALLVSSGFCAIVIGIPLGVALFITTLVVHRRYKKAMAEQQKTEMAMRQRKEGHQQRTTYADLHKKDDGFRMSSKSSVETEKSAEPAKRKKIKVKKRIYKPVIKRVKRKRVRQAPKKAPTPQSQ